MKTLLFIIISSFSLISFGALGPVEALPQEGQPSSGRQPDLSTRECCYHTTDFLNKPRIQGVQVADFIPQFRENPSETSDAENAQ